MSPRKLQKTISITGILLITTLGCVRVVSSISSAEPSAPGNPGSSGESLIKMSMDRYKALRSFSTTCNWNMSVNGMPGATAATRSMSFVAPNRFKVHTTMGTGFEMSAVSDGKTLVEASSVGNQPAMSYSAPADLASVSSMEMQHPMFCGTLLYKFFGGSSCYGQLVDTSKGAPTLGADEKVGDEVAQHVKFYAVGTDGNTDVLIGRTSGTVYKISYDDDGLMKQMQQFTPKNKSGAGAFKSTTVEDYSQIKFDPKLDSTLLDTASAAKGLKVVDASSPSSGGDDPKPPVPLGSPAPEFSVTPLGGGKPVSLKSLRGKPVFVDLWATWCPPCRESLPHTEALYKEFASKGLQVMTVSDEETSTITSFISKNHYTFPAFRDPGDAVNTGYNIQGIPTVLVIDKNGNLQSYLVGLRSEDELRSALKKVGIQ